MKPGRTARVATRRRSRHVESGSAALGSGEAGDGEHRQATVERAAALLAEAGDDARAAGLRRHVAGHAVDLAEAYGLLEATVDRLCRSRGAARAVDDASRRLLLITRAFLRLAVALERYAQHEVAILADDVRKHADYGGGGFVAVIFEDRLVVMP